MPLDNTTSIKDIITALQTFEGINAKADLASVIGNPATSDDTMATLVALIQSSKNTLATKMDDGSTGADPLQTLVDRLTMGKKWASGTAGSGTSITVSGLLFKPSYVLVTGLRGGNASNHLKDAYWAGQTTDYLRTYAYSPNGGVFSGNWSISDVGFNRSYDVNMTNLSWIAFE